MLEQRTGQAPRRRRERQILQRLHKEYPKAETALQFKTPLQLLIATILSAQCTDVRVNMVTPSLFATFKDVGDYAHAALGDLEKAIRSTGFYHNKAKNIQGACRMLLERFEGRVPETLEELITLPGVGRKTANCVLGAAFDKAEGIVVDTHVYRLSRRLGLAVGTTPEKVERELITLYPQKDWIALSHLLVLHGRKYCIARKPKCDSCPLESICPRIGVRDKSP